MKLPNLFIVNFFRLFSDSITGQKALNKVFMTLLFVTTIGIEIYTIMRTDCSYALEFVITNFTFIAASLGMSLFGGVIKTKQLYLQAQNGNGNGHYNGNNNQRQ
jgi:hypothetical protein